MLTRDHLYLGSLIMMALAAVAFLYGLWGLVAVGRMWLWDTTEGQLVHVRQWTERQGYSRHHDNQYYLQVRYDYEVAGRPYSSWRISPGYSDWHDEQGYPCHSFEFSGDRDEAAAGLHRGRRVKVTYDPGDPGDAVLRAELTRYHWLALVFGPVFFGFGLYLFRTLKANEAWADRQERKRGPDIRQD